ncbi:MAG: hypothetical protein M3083_05550 [Actinomycetota bacterium]|nr:hypothetical protein [Actinomycetota bacterium]MDQ6947934.1 hypothetical protein [Actinomycetota bacterium]
MSDLGIRTSDDPLRAWRYWRLDGPRGRLRSVSQRQFLWEPGRPQRAQCVGDRHAAPNPGCSCGIYGAADLDALREHSLCLDPGPLVVGEVALWGVVVPEEGASYRARFAYPLRLWLVDDEFVDPPSVQGSDGADWAALTADGADGADGAASDGLAAYGVPVAHMTVFDAVGEVSSAIRRFLTMSSQTSGRTARTDM